MFEFIKSVPFASEISIIALVILLLLPFVLFATYKYNLSKNKDKSTTKQISMQNALIILVIYEIFIIALYLLNVILFVSGLAVFALFIYIIYKLSSSKK